MLAHMSTLWTPDGEHPVDPSAPDADTTAPPAAEADIDRQSAEADIDRAAAEAMAAELMEARRQLLDVDARAVVANHALGIYELAAIHLTADEPDLDQARVAVDALGGLVDALQGRWGENEATLDEALHSIRLLYVQRHQELAATADETPTDG